MNKGTDRFLLKSARIRILCLSLILGLVFAVSSIFLAVQYMGKTKSQRLLHLKQSVQIARNAIEPILAEYRGLNISMENALEQTRDRVRTMVYNDHTGKNYIFMSSYDGIMLVQPFEPQKEMTDVWDLQDANGVYIIQELVKSAKSREGQGYVTYHYQRPGETSAQEKISYVIGIPELGCYIGTGQYMADIRKSQMAYIVKVAGVTALLIVLLLTLVWSSMKEIGSQNMMLKRAEREITAIFDNTFQFIGSLSPEGILQKANRSSLALIGASEAEVVGRAFWETPWWQDEQTKQRLKHAVHDCAKGNFCRFEVTHINMENDLVYVDFSLSPIFSDTGEVIFLLAEGRDISEQILARNDLVREKVLLDNIIESLPGLFYLFKHENGQYVLKKWNYEQFERILGYSRDEVKNAQIVDFISDEDIPTLDNAVANLLAKGGLNSQFDTKTKDGRTIPILYLAKHVRHETDSYIVGTGIELTDKIKAEKEKKRLEAMLAQSQKMEAMGTLAGGIAHDFNNILSAVLGYAELVKRKLPTDDHTNKLQERVINAAIRAKNLVNQILIFSRQSELEMKPVHLGEICKEALTLIRSSIPTTIEIRQNIPDDSGTILADATQIHQIIMNLCTNAYHAMRTSGGILNLSLTAQEIVEERVMVSDVRLAPGRYYRLEVSDTGHGMERATLDRIFDPYFTTKEKGEGTGLGLSVVHGIVKNCGGEITVHSTTGQGTRVIIYFPELTDEMEALSDQPETVLQTGSERVLLVDDDQMIVDMMKHSLSDLGYQVSAFSSSPEALDAFRTQPEAYDLVITDMTMPKMTGMDLSKEILKVRPQIPIILCTGYSDLLTRDEVRSTNIKVVLIKPIPRDLMSRTIREVLAAD